MTTNSVDAAGEGMFEIEKAGKMTRRVFCRAISLLLVCILVTGSLFWFRDEAYAADRPKRMDEFSNEIEIEYESGDYYQFGTPIPVSEAISDNKWNILG